MLFDWFGKRKSVGEYPTSLMHKNSVSKSEYDIVYKWYEEKRDELDRVRQYLEPFASTGSNIPGLEQDSTVQLAANAHDLLTAGSATIKQQAREIEQLQDQLQEVNTEGVRLLGEIKMLGHKLELNNAVATELAKRTEQMNAALNKLAESDEIIERQAVEIDGLQKALAKRKEATARRIPKKTFQVPS